MTPRTAEFSGRFTLAGEIDRLFELFSPLGERAWVPGWDPQLLHPPGAAWEPGLIFRTPEETGDAVWIVTQLDRRAHEVEYHRMEPRRYVARVSVACATLAGGGTEVRVRYAFVGLTAEGNAEVERMTADAYREKLERWQRWITASSA